jgi:hypothetical protein
MDGYELVIVLRFSGCCGRRIVLPIGKGRQHCGSYQQGALVAPESIKLEKDPSQCKLFDKSSGTNEYVLQFGLPEIAIRKSFKHLCKY